MPTRRLIVKTIVVASFALLLPASANAAPMDKVRDCSDVAYRTSHLKECNLQPSPFLIGDRDDRCTGLCGILGHIPIIGGWF